MTCDEYKQKYAIDFVVSRTARKRKSNELSKQKNAYEPLSKTELLEKLREVAHLHGEPLTFKILTENGYGHLVGLARKFGSLTNALKEAGLKTNIHDDWPSEEILEEIRQLDKAGHSMTYHAVWRRSAALAESAQWYYGSWPGALEAAGISQDKKLRQERADNRLRERLIEWASRNGPLSRAAFVDSGETKLYEIMRKHFGSLEEAARALGLPYERMRAKRLSEQEWHEALSEWTQQHGPLNFKQLKETGEERLYARAKKQYGSLKAAAKALGLPFKCHRKRKKSLGLQ
jgi:molybdenum-dependent DNA-binding transcriptional regulator ModE